MIPLTPSTTAASLSFLQAQSSWGVTGFTVRLKSGSTGFYMVANVMLPVREMEEEEGTYECRLDLPLTLRISHSARHDV
eukprot:superscaffoldBa00004459_g18915